MKWAAGPLLFLGACRIHTPLEAKHRASPCGRGVEGTTQGARPSEKGWDRSQCRYKAQAVWSHPAPLRFRYGSLPIHYRSFTVPLRFLYGLLRPITPLLRPHDYGGRGRRKNSNAYNQRKPRPSPKRGAGGAAPTGGTACPPVSKTLEGGPGGTTAQAKPIPPLKDGASQIKTPFPKRGAGGAAPAGGTACPPVSKTLEGGPGGTTAQAKPIPPLKDGASQIKTPFPKRGAGGAAPAGVASVPALVLGGRLGRGSHPLARKRPDAPGEKTPPPSPKQGARGAAPAGGTASPPVSKTLEGGQVGQRRQPPPTAGTARAPTQSRNAG